MGWDVGDVAHLTAEFEVAGEFADPTTVTVRWRTPAGVTESDVAVRDSVGHFSYDLPIQSAGRWRWEFEGTGDAAAVQGSAFTARPTLASGGEDPTVLVSADEVRVAMLGGTLTDAQVERVEQLIPQLVDALELRLNRLLYPRTITETHPGLAPGQRLVPYKGPVRSVVSITVDGIAETDTARVRSPGSCSWTPGVPIVMVYEAGDDVRPAVTGVLADILARTMSAPAQAASGALRSYSVEGTSITYGDVADGGTGGSGRLKVGDVRALGRLHRPVFLT